MSALTPLYLLGILAVAAPIVFHLIRRVAAGRGAVQLVDLPVAVTAPPDPPQPARQHRCCSCSARRPSACWPSRSPGRSCARRPAGTSARTRQRRIGRPDRHQRQPAPRRPLGQCQGGGRQVIADCGPTEELAVLAFDATTRPVLGFRESHARSGAAAGGRTGPARWPGADLGRDRPRPGPDRRRGRRSRTSPIPARRAAGCRAGSS